METSEAGVGAGGVAPRTRNPSLRTGRRRGLAGSEHGSCLPFSRRFEHEPCGRRPDSRSRGALTVAGLCRDLTGFATTRLGVARYHGGRRGGPCVRGSWALAPGVVRAPASRLTVRGPQRPRPRLGVGHDDVSMVMTASLISWLSEATWPSRVCHNARIDASAARAHRFRARCGSRSPLDKTARHTEDPNDPFRVIPKTRLIRSGTSSRTDLAHRRQSVSRLRSTCR